MKNVFVYLRRLMIVIGMETRTILCQHEPLSLVTDEYNIYCSFSCKLC